MVVDHQSPVFLRREPVELLHPDFAEADTATKLERSQARATDPPRPRAICARRSSTRASDFQGRRVRIAACCAPASRDHRDHWTWVSDGARPGVYTRRVASGTTSAGSTRTTLGAGSGLNRDPGDTGPGSSTSRPIRPQGRWAKARAFWGTRRARHVALCRLLAAAIPPPPRRAARPAPEPLRQLIAGSPDYPTTAMACPATTLEGPSAAAPRHRARIRPAATASAGSSSPRRGCLCRCSALVLSRMLSGWPSPRPQRGGGAPLVSSSCRAGSTRVAAGADRDARYAQLRPTSRSAPAQHADVSQRDTRLHWHPIAAPLLDPTRGKVSVCRPIGTAPPTSHFTSLHYCRVARSTPFGASAAGRTSPPLQRRHPLQATSLDCNLAPARASASAGGRGHPRLLARARDVWDSGIRAADRGRARRARRTTTPAGRARRAAPRPSGCAYQLALLRGLTAWHTAFPYPGEDCVARRLAGSLGDLSMGSDEGRRARLHGGYTRTQPGWLAALDCAVSHRWRLPADLGALLPTGADHG